MQRLAEKAGTLERGEMFDLLHDRGQAVKMYQMAAASGGDQSQADAARRYLKTPFVEVKVGLESRIGKPDFGPDKGRGLGV